VRIVQDTHEPPCRPDSMCSRRKNRVCCTDSRGTTLLGLVAEVGDQVVSVLALLETAKGHLGARDVLLGVLEVFKLLCVSQPYVDEFDSTGRSAVMSIPECPPSM